jgi:hypothetical protein
MRHQDDTEPVAKPVFGERRELHSGCPQIGRQRYNKDAGLPTIAAAILGYVVPSWDGGMFWTPELAAWLEDAPWPATKEELLDYAERSGAPLQLIENLRELPDDDTTYEGIEDIWPEYEPLEYLDEENEDEGEEEY